MVRKLVPSMSPWCASAEGDISIRWPLNEQGSEGKVGSRDGTGAR